MSSTKKYQIPKLTPNNYVDWRGLIAARPSARLINTACSRCTPLWKGVQGLHTIPSTLHTMCTPTIGVHMASRRARQACRACTPVWRACKACTPFGQACRPCTPVGSRKPLNSRGLRYFGTLIRVQVPRTLIAGLTSAS
ncbi:hypothetical protein PCANC_00562 [Puccinia coronata f. sp. avenae]|uniref:Uncharacterized protein n=1 Tax=Puccinia coronata f. sp. avenae TaxID=200324 RepID=A0A2N5W880_9BASI|nr:hypothetical protein PCANC_00562 [Puccinia coronata f. sp. avenae]